MKKQIIVGFDVYTYGKSFLDGLTDRQKHEIALVDCDAVIYDCVEDFFNTLNDNLVDTENMRWYCIKID